MLSFILKQGNQGPSGPVGSQGPRGEKGGRGENGNQGPVGKPGPKVSNWERIRVVLLEQFYLHYKKTTDSLEEDSQKLKT